MKIAPSILSANFAELGRDVQLVEALEADYIHIDVMDGHFVDNITLGPQIVSAIRPYTKLPLDVHLMISNPDKYIDDFAQAGADIITVHFEATNHLHAVIQKIKKLGIKAGVTLNPGTPVELLSPILPYVDLVLVMTVNPGFGGQSFIKEMVSKISWLDQVREAENYQFEIEVDGGINDQTAKVCLEAGCDVFVAGSYIYNAENPAVAIQKLREVERRD